MTTQPPDLAAIRSRADASIGAQRGSWRSLNEASLEDQCAVIASAYDVPKLLAYIEAIEAEHKALLEAERVRHASFVVHTKTHIDGLKAEHKATVERLEAGWLAEREKVRDILEELGARERARQDEIQARLAAQRSLAERDAEVARLRIQFEEAKLCTRCGSKYDGTGSCSNKPCQGGIGEWCMEHHGAPFYLRIAAPLSPPASPQQADCEYLHCGEPGGCPTHKPQGAEAPERVTLDLFSCEGDPPYWATTNLDPGDFPRAANALGRVDYLRADLADEAVRLLRKFERRKPIAMQQNLVAEIGAFLARLDAKARP